MSENNHYIFDGCDTVELAQTYGTPLYVISESYISERCKEIRENFIEKYPKTAAVYASKAFQTLEMCKIMKEEGLGLDVVSGGELFTALKAGMDPSKIVFHGNNKSYEECAMALDNSVGTIVVDSFSELSLLDEIAERRNKKAAILIRITPGVDSHTHKYISTGHLDSKFGFPPEVLLRDGILDKVFDLPNIDLKGFHFHIGSQLTDNQSHLLAMDVLLDFIKEVREAKGFVPRELNVGGGFGIQYAGDPPRKPLTYFTDPMMEKLIAFCKEEEIPCPKVVIEPGRWIVGESGITLYRVGTIKTSPAGRTYISVDGGFPDNPRTALYQAKYDVEAIEKINEPKEILATIAGKCCESGDILVWDVMLPKMNRGDLLAVLCTGAYNYSMASNYNRTPRPAVVMVKEGQHRLSVRRETYEDLLEREI
ncbi:MAG: diaminopimelate decarboxylase [Anaerovoracaceae bacterium]|jgi:diaminopimelate decarboxylase